MWRRRLLLYDMEAQRGSDTWASRTAMMVSRFLQSNLLLTFLLVFTIFVYSPVAGIRCVQCTSDRSEECITAPPSAVLCEDVQSRYCIVVKELLNDTLKEVTRTCSPVDLGVKCHPDSNSLTNEKMTVCHETCYQDGCNGERFKSIKSPKTDKSGVSHKSAGHIVILDSVAAVFAVICAVILTH